MIDTMHSSPSKEPPPTPLRGSTARVDFLLHEGKAPPGCSVLSPSGRRCRKPGKMRMVSCIHEHMGLPSEVCDGCAFILKGLDCQACAENPKEPHVGCKMLVLLAPAR